MTDQQLILEEPTSSKRNRNSESTIGAWLSDIKEADVKAPHWAKFPDARNATYVTKIKQGIYAQTEPGEFESLSRTVDAEGNRAPKGKVWIYARLHTEEDDA